MAHASRRDELSPKRYLLPMTTFGSLGRMIVLPVKAEIIGTYTNQPSS